MKFREKPDAELVRLLSRLIVAPVLALLEGLIKLALAVMLVGCGALLTFLGSFGLVLELNPNPIILSVIAVVLGTVMLGCAAWVAGVRDERYHAGSRLGR